MKIREENVALVKDRSGGIGRGVALKHAAEGTSVVLTARRIDEGEETAQLVRDAVIVKQSSSS
ncbi:MAG: NADP-dependent 3-hydroxy acid dehydrogenase YdfG [Candidatus Azotimanducaceae bacterium]|jgi:NADP-dependent 3-hydroxy acid dehydrogenase YdfG